jgi:hypothetical protein
MGFEEIFENNRRYYRNYNENGHHDDKEHSYNSRYIFSGHGNNVHWQNILEKTRNNKKLKIIVLLAGLLVLTIVIVLIVVLLPLIIKLLNYITQNGLQGIVNEITGFLDKILKGTAN